MLSHQLRFVASTYSTVTRRRNNVNEYCAAARRYITVVHPSCVAVRGRYLGDESLAAPPGVVEALDEERQELAADQLPAGDDHGAPAIGVGHLLRGYDRGRTIGEVTKNIGVRLGHLNRCMAFDDLVSSAIHRAQTTRRLTLGLQTPVMCCCLFHRYKQTD